MRKPNRKLWKPGMMQFLLFVRCESGMVIEMVMDDVRGRDKRHVAGLLSHGNESEITNIIEEAEKRDPPPPPLARKKRLKES